MARSDPPPTGDAPEPRPTGASRRPSRRGLGAAVLLVAATVAVVLVAQQALRLLPDSLNPFEEETRDRSGPVLLQSIRDLSRYEAASGSFQVIVDLEKDARFLPDAVRGRRTLFIGQGSVDAYIDFSRMGSGAIAVNADRTAATVRLPRAQLAAPALDVERSRVFAVERGLLDRVGDFFSRNPADQRQLYVLASQKIQQAAAQSGLRERAEQNARLMLENMLRTLGFTTVTVRLAAQ
ncbi:DUF4230 domain-containing protein [Actinomadura rubrobrunea]|nr:DUF4230 domain-containing protein [Actinomadura rubrobrunea]